MKKETKAKYDLLCDLIGEKGRLAVAFSSGVDSTMLLKTAADVLSGNVIAVTARSVSFPERESNESVRFCSQIGVPQIIVETDQFSIEGFADNPADRCYICKKALFGAIIEASRNNGFDTVAEGSNIDDLSDYRPGLKAIAELGVMSPLREAGLFKEEIREISRELGLPTWSKPSFACLATRFVYGEKITEEKLLQEGEMLLSRRLYFETEEGILVIDCEKRTGNSERHQTLQVIRENRVTAEVDVDGLLWHEKAEALINLLHSF